jgi:hypothetical protein
MNKIAKDKQNYIHLLGGPGFDSMSPLSRIRSL